MNAKQIETFKQAVIAAVDKHLADGGTLSIGTFGSGECRCPISCLMGIDEPEDNSSRALVEHLSKKMGFDLSDEEVWSFIDGFDGNSWRHDNTMKSLGRELRNKYRPDAP